MNLAGQCFTIWNRLLMRRSNLIFRSILRTSPFVSDPDAQTIIYTVLDRNNCHAYLLAIKSFFRFFSGQIPCRVVVQDDGSLDAKSRRTLNDHIVGIEIYAKEDSLAFIRRKSDPELSSLLPPLEQCHFFLTLKLLNVIYRFSDKKIILFDSDLLFLRQPEFILNWINDGIDQCFYSDGGNSLTAVFREMGFDFSAVDINDFNAGLIGLWNAIPEPILIGVLRRIAEQDQKLFQNWEIEQAIWSVLFNGLPNPINLDKVRPDYVASGYWPIKRIQTSIVAHFVGSVRFRRFWYPRLAKQIVRDLSTRQPDVMAGTTALERGLF